MKAVPSPARRLRVWLILGLGAAATLATTPSQPGESREAAETVVVTLTPDEPAAKLTITLSAVPGSLRGRTGASASLFVHQPRPPNAATPPAAPVEIELRHPGTDQPPPESFDVMEGAALSFAPFTTCAQKAGPCEEAWDLGIDWREPHDTDQLRVEVGLIVWVRYGDGADPPPDDGISVTIE